MSIKYVESVKKNAKPIFRFEFKTETGRRSRLSLWYIPKGEKLPERLAIMIEKFKNGEIVASEQLWVFPDDLLALESFACAIIATIHYLKKQGRTPISAVTPEDKVRYFIRKAETVIRESEKEVGKK
ncbi:MAG: hypothetical protein ACTSXX_06085 [Candidatus Baldrarchaeia archaeon]